MIIKSGGMTMQDLEKLGKELRRSGKNEDIRALADSEDGRRLGAMLDGKAVEEAARKGDGEALRRMLNSVLSTQEGPRLARQVQEILKK